MDGFVSNTVSTEGMRLHVRQRLTDTTATPYVLLHGLAVSHRYLMPTARRLGPGSVYVPDLAGFGLSSKPDAALDVGDHAGVVAALLDTLGTSPVALVGNSFGCQVAVELALRRPDLVAALVLVGPTTDPAAGARPVLASLTIGWVPALGRKPATGLSAELSATGLSAAELPAGRRRSASGIVHAVGAAIDEARLGHGGRRGRAGLHPRTGRPDPRPGPAGTP